MNTQRLCGLFGTFILLTSPFARPAELDARLTDSLGHPLADAVLTATPLFPVPAASAPHKMRIVDQIDKEFVPYVIAIDVNTKVSFPNRDNIRHEVYSFSPAKKFELPLYAGRRAPPVLFDKPGVVVLGCNIHDWMIGYIYVSATPYYAQSGTDGYARLSGLPDGDYTLKIWHPQLIGNEDDTARNVTLSSPAPRTENWKLAIRPRPSPHPDAAW